MNALKQNKKTPKLPRGILGLLEKKNELKIDSWVLFILV